MKTLSVATAVALAGLAAAPALGADVPLRAATLNRYESTEIRMNAGDRVVFTNTDVLARHNVTAIDEDPSGTPLFASPTIGSGEMAVASGTDELPAGRFGFFCTLHPSSMRGQILVAGVPDTQAPAVTLAVVRRSSTRVRATRRLPVTVRTDEIVGATIRARAKGVTIAKAAVRLQPGATTLSLKVTQVGARLLRRHGRLTVRVVVRAADLAGNPAVATATRTFSP